VRNLFEAALARQADRLADSNPDNGELSVLTAEDVGTGQVVPGISA